MSNYIIRAFSANRLDLMKSRFFLCADPYCQTLSSHRRPNALNRAKKRLNVLCLCVGRNVESETYASLLINHGPSCGYLVGHTYL